MSSSILLSGGIDSIALAYWKRPTYAFTVNYGQKPANAELRSSQAVCDKLNIQHVVLTADCGSLGSGDLGDLPSMEVAPSSEWWPYRNQLLITLACMKGLSIGVKELIVGSVASDGFHKDGTNGFYELINQIMLYQEGGIKIFAPAIQLSSVDLVLQSGVPPEVLYYAHSCHKSDTPCGNCRGCKKYMEVIQKLKNANWEQS
jgi:7-cyano-7-deazaguanine synthase